MGFGYKWMMGVGLRIELFFIKFDYIPPVQLILSSLSKNTPLKGDISISFI